MTDPLAVETGDTATARHQLTGRLRRACALADLRPSLQTAPAAAAGRRELKHYVVPGTDVVDGRADLDDLSGPFVTQCHRHRAWTIAVYHGEVRVTQPCTGDANQQLDRLWRRESDFLDGQWLRPRVGAGRADRPQDSGFASYRHK
jgi:hypothetical protein